MGATIAEKILARASGKKEVTPGEIVTSKIDLLYNLETNLVKAHEHAVKSGLPEGIPKFADPDKVAVIIADHKGCHGVRADVARYKFLREFCERYGIKKCYDINTGIAHAVVPEEGLARPGMLVVGNDSHSTVGGACNTLAIPISEVETAYICLTGELWFMVPESIKFICNGTLQEGVVSKDIFLHAIGKYTPSMAQYRSLEFKGPVIDDMGMDGRLTLSCQAIELGAKCAPFEPDSTCLKYVQSTPLSADPLWPTPADPDATYEKVIEEDYSDLEPQVALPHGFDVVKSVSDVEGVHIDQANLGSCANSRYDDLEIAARVVKGKKLKARMIFAPGSWKIYLRALKDGLLETLVQAGVSVESPSCMPCAGRGACIADGEVAVGATTRNFRGRFGSPDSEIYLASPATAAASAVMGEITDPRKLL